jgi:hypothetical protein
LEGNEKNDPSGETCPAGIEKPTRPAGQTSQPETFAQTWGENVEQGFRGDTIPVLTGLASLLDSESNLH